MEIDPKNPDTVEPSGIGRVAGKQRVTMLDIARVAGCSQSTVSFVLNANNSVKISDATRQRVMSVAKELGYPVMPGLAVRSRTEGTVAFVVDKITTSPEGVVMIDGVHQVARTMGALVMTVETDGDPDIEARTIATFVGMGVRAIIYACIFTREVDVPPALLATDIPVILLNCYSAKGHLPAIVPGEIAGGFRATNVLIEAGHRRIGTITGEMFMEAAQDRLHGYRNSLATADIPFDPRLVEEGDWSPSAGYRGTKRLMALADPPTAIFCQNDRTAIGCYEALKDLGKRIPEDVSVVGYDDTEVARHLSPPLTTLILPSRAMGRWSLEQILHTGSDVPTIGPLVKMECQLVERDSVAPPPGCES